MEGLLHQRHPNQGTMAKATVFQVIGIHLTTYPGRYLSKSISVLALGFYISSWGLINFDYLAHSHSLLSVTFFLS
jgi:hypothetical protein